MHATQHTLYYKGYIQIMQFASMTKGLSWVHIELCNVPHFYGPLGS